MKPTKSSCARAATTAAGTSASRTPAPLLRFAAVGVTPGPLALREDCPGLFRPLQSWVSLGGEVGGEGMASPTCPSLQLTHLFDNEGTVVFAIFMALWGELPWAPVGASLSSRTTPAPSTLAANPGTHVTPLPTPAAATVFLELWKRHRARVVLHWDLYGWDEDQVRGARGPRQGLSLPRALCGPHMVLPSLTHASPRLRRVSRV